MKLESFKDKKVTRRKMILISLGVIIIVGVSLLLYKTFASFSREVSFPMMSGKVNYYGNADLIFVFYKGDQELDEMPQKGNPENLAFDYGTCDNGATIEWNEEKWAPLVKGLNKTKTRCSLYFKEFKMVELRQVSSFDTNGMWNYRDKLTKIVIEKRKSKKEATEGQTVYGPFDESSTRDRAIESYVVCEAEDTNCIGYLQGDGGIKLDSDSSYLFNEFSNVSEIEGIENLDTSRVTDMDHMFYNCSQLQELDLSSFDTSSVENMDYMFDNMSSLTSLTFGNNFTASSVTSMYMMFENCSQLQELDLSSFNTSSVKTMTSMFGNMKNLRTLIFGDNFDTSNVTKMGGMFGEMSSLQTLDLSGFNTSSVENMNSMFSGMSNLQELDLSSFDTSSVTNMSLMFYGMSNLTSLTFGDNFDTSNVTNMRSMFQSCSQLQELDLSNFDTSSVTNMNSMFFSTPKLKKIIYGPNFIHKDGVDTTYMFVGCPANKPDATVHSSWEGVF